MKNLIKVDGHKDLYRNESGAIVNMNKTALERAKARKVARVKEQNELNELKSEVKELKELILQLSKSIDYK